MQNAKQILIEKSIAFHGIHKQYMNTSVFTDEGKKLKEKLAIAREEYISAYKAVYPSHIVF